jgi:DNA mismatch endonuclease, patch repair protein
MDGSTRTADIAFARARVVVFLDGCFWHGCPEHGTFPKTNSEWWRRKILANLARDRDTDAKLKMQGWKVIRIWEHVSVDEAVNEIASAVGRRL